MASITAIQGMTPSTNDATRNGAATTVRSNPKPSIYDTYSDNDWLNYYTNGQAQNYPTYEHNDWNDWASQDSRNDWSGGNSYGGNDGGGSYDGGGSTYADYLAALEAQRQAELEAERQRQRQKIDNANSALDTQGKAQEQAYRNQMLNINNDYQKLRNQSEVQRYKSRGSLREALANRGALDSGAGRMESLVMNNNYNNALNEIGLQENSELNRVNQAINDMWGQINMQKAQNELTYGTGLDTGNYSSPNTNLNYTPYQYTGSGLAAASNAIPTVNFNGGVGDGVMTQASNAAAAQAALGSGNASALRQALANGIINDSQYRNAMAKLGL